MSSFIILKLMKKSLIFISLILAIIFSSVAHSEVDHETKTLMDIKYKLSGSLQNAPGDLELQRSLEKLGLVDITSLYRDDFKKLHVAHVLASEDLSKLIVLRYDFVPSDSGLKGRVIKLDASTFLIHTSNANQRQIAVYFKGYSQVEINSVLQKVNSSKSVESQYSTSSLLMNSIIQVAQAEPVECGQDHESRMKGIKRIGAYVLSKVGNCAKDFFGGVVGALYKDNLDLFSGKIFKDIANLVTVGKEIFNSVSSNVTTMFAGMEKAPDVMVGIVCNILGSVVGKGIIAVLTAGAGLALELAKGAQFAAKIAMLVANAMEKSRAVIADILKGKNAIAKAAKNFNKVQDAADKIGKTSDGLTTAAEAMKCAREIKPSGPDSIGGAPSSPEGNEGVR